VNSVFNDDELMMILSSGAAWVAEVEGGV